MRSRGSARGQLVQIYTALVYEGPGLPRRISRGLAALLRRDGLTLNEAIGRDGGGPASSNAESKPAPSRR